MATEGELWTALHGTVGLHLLPGDRLTDYPEYVLLIEAIDELVRLRAELADLRIAYNTADDSWAGSLTAIIDEQKREIAGLREQVEAVAQAGARVAGAILRGAAGVEPCEDCGATGGVRAFGTDQTPLCPACYARAERNYEGAARGDSGR